jgi:hypothetical protein
LEIDKLTHSQTITYDLETIEIDFEIMRRDFFGRGISKYRELSTDNLIAVRNHLHNESRKLLTKLIDENRRAITDCG